MFVRSLFAILLTLAAGAQAPQAQTPEPPPAWQPDPTAKAKLEQLQWQQFYWTAVKEAQTAKEQACAGRFPPDDCPAPREALVLPRPAATAPAPYDLVAIHGTGHELQAIFAQGNRRATYTVGSELPDGATVEAITGTTVTLRTAAGRKVIPFRVTQ